VIEKRSLLNRRDRRWSRQMTPKASTWNEQAARPDPDEDEETLEEIGGDETWDDEDEEMEDDADGSPTR
jgi:hypothetical protein